MLTRREVLRRSAGFAAATGAGALRANPANRGHVIHSQLMDRPWSTLPCCVAV